MTPDIRLNNLRNFFDKLEEDKGLKSFADIAREYDIDASYLSQLNTGKRAFGEKSARNFEKIFGLPEFYFDKSEGIKLESNARTITKPEVRYVPILNITQAGEWRAYFEDAEADNFEPIVGDFGEHIYGVVLDGDSMLPDFKSGDIVFVDPDMQPSAGDFVIAMCCKDSLNATTFKKYRPRGFDEQGKEYFELVPLNDDFPRYDSRNIRCKIIATAVEHKKRLK